MFRIITFGIRKYYSKSRYNNKVHRFCGSSYLNHMSNIIYFSETQVLVRIGNLTNIDTAVIYIIEFPDNQMKISR